MVIAVWLLIVTGIYTGSMAPGVSVEVRLRAEGVATVEACRDLGGTFRDAMSRFGAKGITVDCVPR